MCSPPWAELPISLRSRRSTTKSRFRNRELNHVWRPKDLLYFQRSLQSEHGPSLPSPCCISKWPIDLSFTNCRKLITTKVTTAAAKKSGIPKNININKATDSPESHSPPPAASARRIRLLLFFMPHPWPFQHAPPAARQFDKGRFVSSFQGNRHRLIGFQEEWHIS